MEKLRDDRKNDSWQRLQEVRLSTGLNCLSFAKELGVSRSYIYVLEKEHMNVSRSVAEKVSERFGTDPDWIMYGDRKDEPRATEVKPRVKAAPKKHTVKKPKITFKAPMDRKITVPMERSVRRETRKQDAVSAANADVMRKA